MRKLRIAGLIMGLLVFLMVNCSVSFGFDFKSALDIKNFKLPDPFGFMETPYIIRLYNSVGMDDASLNKFLKKHQPGFTQEKLVEQGYSFPYAALAGDAKLKKAGFVVIGDRGVEYDQIDSFTIIESPASGARHAQFAGKKQSEILTDFDFNYTHCFIINVDEGFLKRHQVQTRKISELPATAAPKDFLPKAAAYLQPIHKKGDLDFVSKHESPGVIRRRLTEYYNLKLYQIAGMGNPRFMIAAFEPKKDKNYDGFEPFSFLLVNGKISKYGHFSQYLAFSIDKKVYLQFFNQVVPGSGYCGKSLYTFEVGRILKLVTNDFSYAD